jgi:hypothetical protein
MTPAYSIAIVVSIFVGFGYATQHAESAQGFVTLSALPAAIIGVIAYVHGRLRASKG